MTVIVQFNVDSLPYLRGETAGLPDTLAQRVISAGVATRYRDGIPRESDGSQTVFDPTEKRLEPRVPQFFAKRF